MGRFGGGGAPAEAGAPGLSRAPGVLGAPGAVDPIGAYAAFLAEAVRRASLSGRLSSRTALARECPAPQEVLVALAALAGEGGPLPSPQAAVELSLGRAQDQGDIRLVRRKSEIWYFSSLSMSDTYALHLARAADSDKVLLIAETVRDESRIYPRPTDPRCFSDPPFGLVPDEIDEALSQIRQRPETADISFCTASNGAVYLYSKEFLEERLAESLAEWIEVGQKENP